MEFRPSSPILVLAADQGSEKGFFSAATLGNRCNSNSDRRSYVGGGISGERRRRQRSVG